MNYEEAVKRWGARKLDQSGYGPYGKNADAFDLVEVEARFDEGYACCGGADPSCYCSLAESPSAEVIVRGRGLLDGKPQGEWTYSIDVEDFDFATFLREVLEAAE